MKGYTKFFRSTELESHHQIQFSVIPRAILFGGVLLSEWIQQRTHKRLFFNSFCGDLDYTRFCHIFPVNFTISILYLVKIFPTMLVISWAPFYQPFSPSVIFPSSYMSWPFPFFLFNNFYYILYIGLLFDSCWSPKIISSANLCDSLFSSNFVNVHFFLSIS